jgi:hypothetical protein
MIERMQERSGEGERGGTAHLVCLEGEREAEADEHDADVLHRAVREQALEIRLHERVEHAHHRGNAPQKRH